MASITVEHGSSNPADLLYLYLTDIACISTENIDITSFNQVAKEFEAVKTGFILRGDSLDFNIPNDLLAKMPGYQLMYNCADTSFRLVKDE